MKHIRPFKKGHLKVTHGHELYYEVCGNPKGVAVLYLHGGPGGGFTDSDKIYFNPKVYKVVFFDQRGSGRSRPFASLHANTTRHLIDDINRLLDHLEIRKTFLFGGSWGSALALLYGISNPERVTGMCLRGIFLATRYECTFYFQQKGGGLFFPDAWERMIRWVPPRHRHSPEKYYYRKMKSKNDRISNFYSYEYSHYELSMLKLSMEEKTIRKLLKRYDYRSLGRIECHYMVNGCFIPENYILKNVKRISRIPISIVQGRYDAVCPPLHAYLLHKKLRNSSLHLLLAGHSCSEPEIEKKLISEMKRFETKLRKA